MPTTEPQKTSRGFQELSLCHLSSLTEKARPMRPLGSTHRLRSSLRAEKSSFLTRKDRLEDRLEGLGRVFEVNLRSEPSKFDFGCVLKDF